MKNQDNQYFFTSDNDSQAEFEDISSSSVKEEDVYSLSDFSGKGKFRKKKHGFWGKISDWWSSCKGWQKAFFITSISLILVFSIAIGAILNTFDYNYKEIDKEELGVENPIDENIVNIALFGIDTRNTKSFKGNSDSIMILSLNNVTKKVKIMSVMRDSLVPITYNGKTTYTKINSAYARGGPELAIKTLNQNFGLDISEYATVNFFGMIDIIDAVGGIEAELTQGEVVSSRRSSYALNGCIDDICRQTGDKPEKYYITTPGKHHLNGIQAVAYSRIRYTANIWGTNNDFGRTDRQRYVMNQLFNKAITLEKTRYVKLAKSLIPCSETSLSYNEIIGLAFDILLKSPTFEQARVPQDEYIMSSPKTPAGSVVYYDLAYVSKLIHAFIYDDITPDTYISTNGVEKNDWYREKVGYYVDSSPSSKPQDSKPNENTNTDTGDDELPDDTEVPDEDIDTENPENPENPDDGTDTEEPENPENPDDGTDTEEPENPETPETPETPTPPNTDDSNGGTGDDTTPPTDENTDTQNGTPTQQNARNKR